MTSDIVPRSCYIAASCECKILFFRFINLHSQPYKKTQKQEFCHNCIWNSQLKCHTVVSIYCRPFAMTFEMGIFLIISKMLLDFVWCPPVVFSAKCTSQVKSLLFIYHQLQQVISRRFTKNYQEQALMARVARKKLFFRDGKKWAEPDLAICLDLKWWRGTQLS